MASEHTAQPIDGMGFPSLYSPEDAAIERRIRARVRRQTWAESAGNGRLAAALTTAALAAAFSFDQRSARHAEAPQDPESEDAAAWPEPTAAADHAAAAPAEDGMTWFAGPPGFDRLLRAPAEAAEVGPLPEDWVERRGAGTPPPPAAAEARLEAWPARPPAPAAADTAEANPFASPAGPPQAEPFVVAPAGQARLAAAVAPDAASDAPAAPAAEAGRPAAPMPDRGGAGEEPAATLIASRGTAEPKAPAEGNGGGRQHEDVRETESSAGGDRGQPRWSGDDEPVRRGADLADAGDDAGWRGVELTAGDSEARGGAGAAAGDNLVRGSADWTVVAEASLALPERAPRVDAAPIVRGGPDDSHDDGGSGRGRRDDEGAAVGQLAKAVPLMPAAAAAADAAPREGRGEGHEPQAIGRRERIEAPGLDGGRGGDAERGPPLQAWRAEDRHEPDDPGPDRAGALAAWIDFGSLAAPGAVLGHGPGGVRQLEIEVAIL